MEDMDLKEDSQWQKDFEKTVKRLAGFLKKVLEKLKSLILFLQWDEVELSYKEIKTEKKKKKKGKKKK